MKTRSQIIRLLTFGAFIATALVNCKTKDVESLTPFTYTFKGLEEVKLPEAAPTQPAAVTMTPATMTSSTAAAAVSSGLSSMSATGQVPAAVQQAAAAVGQAVSSEKAAQLAASFTPDMVKNLSTGGAMPASLKAEVAAIASNPALKTYMPTFTLPTVNGQAIGARVATVASTSATIVKAVEVERVAASNDACRDAATAAFDRVLATLNSGKSSQMAAVETSFNQNKSNAEAKAAPCKSSISAKYVASRAAVMQQYTQGLAALEANKATLGEAMYNMLSVLYGVSYAEAMSMFTTMEGAESNACSAVSAAELVNANAAKAADESRINGNFNNAVAAITAARDRAVASCHNQGGGR